MEILSSTTVQIKKVSAGQVSITDDELAIEEPLQIQLVYGANQVPKNLAVTMRTPGNDRELAAGFLFTEGIIQNKHAIASIQQLTAGENLVQVTLQANVEPLLQQTERNFYTTSGCGVCGKSGIDDIKTRSVFSTINDSLQIAASVLYDLPGRLRAQQAIFESTGGLHAAALFDRDGNFLMLREDVGRHNALDKLIGEALLQDQLPLHHAVLLLSGRASFELIQKAWMAGIQIVAAVGAPSSLAVTLAGDCGITLVGFLRNERFNIYSNGQRIGL